MSRSYDALDKLQADTELEAHLALNILFITAEIDRKQGFTTVDVKTTDSELKKLEFQVPLTEYKQLETAIAEKLGLTVADIRQLVRYHVKN